MKKTSINFLKHPFLELLGFLEFYDLDLMINNVYIDKLDFISNNLYHGTHWIYSFSPSCYIYNAVLWYQVYFFNILDENFNFFFFFFWVNIWDLTINQLFFSVVLDLYTHLSLWHFYYFNNLVNFFESNSINNFLIIYPELVLLKIFCMNYYDDLYTQSRFVFYNFYTTESYLINLNLLIQCLFLIVTVTLFLTFYFSFYTNPIKEENFIDMDYLNSSALVEAEKEIASLDDIILLLVILLYVFGWYFYIHCTMLIGFSMELTFVFYFLPALYFIVVGIPTFLVWDFGVFFLTYLRGEGKSSYLAVELIYDYLAVLIFYIRICIQGIRLILMLFVYLSMQEFVLFLNFSQNLFLGYEFFWENFNYLTITIDSLSYYMIFSFIGTIFYWFYEILHTYFVVTIQFIAFFAIVFWLFLFLYTFFVIEKQENYFADKRNKIKFFYTYLFCI